MRSKKMMVLRWSQNQWKKTVHFLQIKSEQKHAMRAFIEGRETEMLPKLFSFPRFSTLPPIPLRKHIWVVSRHIPHHTIWNQMNLDFGDSFDIDQSTKSPVDCDPWAQFLRYPVEMIDYYFILWRYVRSFCKIWSLSHLSFMGFAMIYQCNSVMYIAHTHTLQSSMQQLLSQRQKILRPKGSPTEISVTSIWALPK